MKFRVIKIENYPGDKRYFLRVKHLLWWRYAIVADYGSWAYTNHHVIRAETGYEILEIYLQKIYKESENPTLHFFERMVAVLRYYIGKKPKGVTFVVDIKRAQRRLKIHKSVKGPSDPDYPETIEFE